MCVKRQILAAARAVLSLSNHEVYSTSGTRSCRLRFTSGRARGPGPGLALAPWLSAVRCAHVARTVSPHCGQHIIFATTFLLGLASQPWTGAEKALLECYRGARCRGGLLPVHLRERACQPVREAIASTLSPSVSLRADGVGRCSSGWQCPSPFRRDAVGGGWMGGAAIVAN